MTEQLGDARRGSELPHETRGVVGAAAGELGALEQQHVGAAELGQMIGRRATDDSATDDDDAGLTR